MTNVIRPTIMDLKHVLSDSRQGLIVSPFFTLSGLQSLDQFWNEMEHVEFWTRGNPNDWAKGFAALPELCGALEAVEKRGGRTFLRMRSDLHAKIYYSLDKKRALFGSSNLTDGGFSTNLEIMAKLEGEGCEALDGWLKQQRPETTEIPLKEFATCVQVSMDAISKAASSRTDDVHDNDLNAAVDLFEETLAKHAGPTVKKGRISEAVRRLPDLEEFIAACKQQKRSRDCKEIVERYEGKYNLQGHVKHAFYGALFFFAEHPEAIEEVYKGLSQPEHARWTQQPWVRSWTDFLKSHGDEVIEEKAFRFRTLKIYLPPALGGSTTTGGGGSGTLRRVLLELAKMLRSGRK